MESARSAGRFTIVEVVVVTTILAILAAFAVPRFPAANIEARSVATTTLGKSIRTSAAMAHARWLAQGKPPRIDIDGQQIAMAFGYPDAAGIEDIVTGLDGFIYDHDDGVFSKTDDGRTPLAGCAVIYSAPMAAGSAPGITIETAGC